MYAIVYLLIIQILKTMSETQSHDPIPQTPMLQEISPGNLLGPTSDLMERWRTIQGLAGPMGANAILTRDKAETDHLTGLLDRNGLKDRLAQLNANSHVNPEDISIVFMDLDNFKIVNDRSVGGHGTGDEVLVEFANFLKNLELRSGEVVARWGGDEFCAVINTKNLHNGKRNPAISKEEAIKGFTQRINDKIRDIAIKIGIPELGVSYGIVAQKPGEKVNDFIARADREMYAMKEQKKQSNLGNL